LDGKEKAAAEVDGMGKVVRRSQGLGGAWADGRYSAGTIDKKPKQTLGSNRFNSNQLRPHQSNPNHSELKPDPT
jgi:hypothetical protein